VNIIKKLFFKNPIFKSGINLTVRKGVKWDCVNINEIVEICKCDSDSILFHAEIIGKQQSIYNDSRFLAIDGA